MRSNFSAVSIFSVSMLASAIALTNSSANAQSTAKVIQGLDNTHYFKTESNGPFYVQAGTFRSEDGANKYKNKLEQKFNHPITVKTQGSYHIVLIGPIKSAAEVRALSGSSTHSNMKKNKINKHVVIGDKDGLAVEPARNHFDVIGALGIANVRSGNALLGVTSSETDRLIQTNRNKWNTFAAQLGVGYVYYMRDAQRYSEQTQWFPSIEPEINLYYLGSNSAIEGDVWRFQSPNFNQMTFKAPLNSTRLMFDAALTIVSKKQYSLYAIGGIGNAWNRLGYNDRDNIPGDPCPNENLNLNKRTGSNFAWELGGGLMYAFNDRVSLSLQYLYTDLGKARSAASGDTGGITIPVIVAPRFNLSAQTGLLGLHIAV